MNADDKKSLTDKIEELKKIKDTDDTEAIKKKLEEMNQLAQSIGAKMYQSQQQAQPGAGAPGAEQPKDGEAKKDEQGPVEGEYQEKK
jgi:molecular chaperone DnaK